MLLLQLIKHFTHYGIYIDTVYENIHIIFPQTGLEEFPSFHAMDFQSGSVCFRFRKAEKSESNVEQTDIMGLDEVIEAAYWKFDGHNQVLNGTRLLHFE